MANPLPRWLPLPPARTRWGLVFGFVLSIFAVSLMEGPIDWADAGPNGPSGSMVDKFAHLGTYFVLTVLVLYALAERPGAWSLALAFLVSNGLGALIELMQAPLPHRNAEPGDLLANLIGAALAMILWWLLVRPRRSRRPARA